MIPRSVSMLIVLGLALCSQQYAVADDELDYHYCTVPTSETVYGLSLLEVSEAHAALARRIHGEYRDAVQESLPLGHTIVGVEVSGSGIQGTPETGYSITLSWYYCVRIGPAPGPIPLPVPPIEP
ncbi:MAG: hypothetical protein ACE361_00080 [Aureliella sp.]